MNIIEAAENGNLEELKKLIKSGADVNAKNEYGNTALIYAAWNGHTDCLSALIVAGADVNAKNNDGYTALTLAARDGQTDCVAVLISAGADVNAKNDDGNTALILAACMGHTECVNALLKSGADINAKDIDYGTALSWAAWYGYKDCVALLKQAQRDLDAKNLGHTSTPSVPIYEQEADNELKELDKSAQVPEVKQSDFSQSLTKTLEEIGTMLLSKNASYGNAALEPIRIFSKADSVEQLKVRIDDKLSRLQRGSDIGEDTVKDLTGYLILFLMARGKNENHN